MKLFRALNRYWSQIHLSIRVMTIGVLATFLLIVAGTIVFRGPVREQRTKVVHFFARIVQLNLNAKKQSGSFLQMIDSVAQAIQMEAWILDEQGQILSSTHKTPLPVAWEEFKAPVDEYEVTWGEGLRFDNKYAVTRLVSEPARYLALYFGREGSIDHAIFLGTLIYALVIIVSMGLYVWRVTVKGTRRLAMNNAGFSVLSAVVGVVIMSLALYALQSILTLSFRGSSHSDIRLSIRSLSDTLRVRVDCGQTLAGINPAVDCNPNSLKPIVLKDEKGVPLTQPLSPTVGKFEPLDNTQDASGVFGTWKVRAYCEGPSANLVIRYAKAISPSEFKKDPLTKRPYDWQNSDTNPLFGPTDRVLCTAQKSTPSPPPLPPPPKRAVARLAMFDVRFTVMNNNSEWAEVDLTDLSKPKSVSSAEFQNFTATENFLPVGPVRFMVSLKNLDVKTYYGNVTVANHTEHEYSNGKLKIRLMKRNDIGQKNGEPPFGHVIFSVLALQGDP